MEFDFDTGRTENQLLDLGMRPSILAHPCPKCRRMIRICETLSGDVVPFQIHKQEMIAGKLETFYKVHNFEDCRKV